MKKHIELMPLYDDEVFYLKLKKTLINFSRHQPTVICRWTIFRGTWWWWAITSFSRRATRKWWRGSPSWDSTSIQSMSPNSRRREAPRTASTCPCPTNNFLSLVRFLLELSLLSIFLRFCDTKIKIIKGINLFISQYFIKRSF